MLCPFNFTTVPLKRGQPVLTTTFSFMCLPSLLPPIGMIISSKSSKVPPIFISISFVSQCIGRFYSWTQMCVNWNASIRWSMPSTHNLMLRSWLSIVYGLPFSTFSISITSEKLNWNRFAPSSTATVFLGKPTLGWQSFSILWNWQFFLPLFYQRDFSYISPYLCPHQHHQG